VDGVCIPEESSPYSASSANSLQVDVKIPTDIAPGDYLLRAEVIALHTAASLNSAQFYASCYQITVSGSGSATPSGVLFPGAYKNTDPGILVDIHAKMSSYVDPGPTVYAGGVSKTPGNSKCSGQAASEGPGGKPATGVSDRSSSKVHDSGES
jgi:cellulase